MLIRLNYKSGKAPYLQIVDQVKHAAASGALRPGEFVTVHRAGSREGEEIFEKEALTAWTK